jgi:hypothetical protein
MTGIPNLPYNYKEYLDDVTKMKPRGTISAGEQISMPQSAGSRGLAKVDNFINSPNQIMKDNDVEDEHEELQRIKQLAGI